MTRTDTNIQTVTIPEDVTVEGYGIFLAGTYRVEMPTYYDPDVVTATDIVMDSALRVVTEEAN